MNRIDRREKSNGQPNRPRVQSIGSLVGQLISRRGYAEKAANDQFHSAVSAVVGKDLSKEVTIGKLHRGVLRIYAADSVTIQELTFQKRTLLKKIQKDFPEAKVVDLRLAVQTK